jgi:hypothetical protein
MLHIINKVAIAYCLVLLLLVHATLFFCGDDHCVFFVERPPLPPEVAYHTRIFISTMLPFDMRTMQILAQWLVIG